MFGWSMTGGLRKYIILWGYFWLFGCKWPKTSQNSHVLRISLSNKQFKIGFFQKALIISFRFQLFLVYFCFYFHNLYLIGLSNFFNSTLLPDQCEDDYEFYFENIGPKQFSTRSH